jgi:hypothetical protein
MTNPFLEMTHIERKAFTILINRANKRLGKPRTKQNPNLRVPISVVVDGKRRNIVVVLAVSKSRDEHDKKPSYKIDLFSAAIHRLATSLSITPEEVLALLACDVSEGVKSLSKTIDSTYQLFRETLPLKHVNGSALFQAIEAK